MAAIDARSEERRTFAVGIVLLVLIVGLVAAALTAHDGAPVGEFTYAKATFKDVGALLAGDDVRMNSVRVGRVERIDLSGGHAIASMKLDGRVPLYRDASAAILSRSPLGQKFVNIVPGTPSAGPLGTVPIGAERTSGTSELDTLLDVFDPMTRQALASSLRELGGGAAGHGADLQAALAAGPSELRNLATVSETLSAPRTAFPALLSSTRDLTSRFIGREGQISQLIDQFAVTLNALAVDNGAPLSDTLRSLPPTLTQANRAFEDLGRPLDDTRTALASLRPGAASLARATPDLRGLLTEARNPLNQVPDFSADATPSVKDLRDTVADLRPFATRAARALERGATPLAYLAPYSADILQLFTDSRSSLAQGDGNRHWLRLLEVPASDDVSTTVAPVVKDPLVKRDPYPAPGEARKERKTTLLGEK